MTDPRQSEQRRPVPTGEGPSAPDCDPVLGGAATRFWQIPRAGWVAIARRTWAQMGSDNVSLVAAGVAFYIFLAFVPLLASIVLVYGLAASPVDVARHMMALANHLPADVAGIVGDQLQSVATMAASSQGLGLIIALAVALYGVTKGTGAVITALNIAYEEKERRGFVRRFLFTLAFAAGAALAGVLASVAVAASALVAGSLPLPGPLEWLGTAGAWTIAAVALGALVALVYRYGPSRERARWSWLVPGAALASAGIVLGTMAFGYYVGNFGNYNATYGALGAVVSFLTWLYVMAYVLIAGAELNAETERHTMRDTTTGPEQPMGDRNARMADTATTAPVLPEDKAEQGPSDQGVRTP